MPDATFFNLPSLAEHLREELGPKRAVLIFAYNGAGKTQLSGAFRDLGRGLRRDDHPKGRDTLYFNAYTEDLFAWDNDLEGDRHRVLELNDDSRFFDGLRELEMEVKVGKLLERYADFLFYIEYDRRKPPERLGEQPIPLRPAVTFFRQRTASGDPIPIKVSRGEENIFIWCFFLAIVQLVLDKAEAYKWVKYIYIDDPVSSLDDNNAVLIAHHLAQLLAKSREPLRFVVSSHHVLFFNVLCNEMKKTRKYFLTRDGQWRGYTVQETDSTPFLYHLSSLAQLHDAARSGALYPFHFNILRRVMEQTACFLGYAEWSDCIKPEPGDTNGTAYKRIIDLMSHGDYSLMEPKEMLPDNKEHFKRALAQFLAAHPFSPTLFQTATR